MGGQRSGDREGARLQSIGRAAALLELMADGAWHPLSTLALAAGLAKPTAHHLLGSLVDTDLAERDERRGRYRLGLRLLGYGRAVERRLDVLALLRPLLLDLLAETGETVNVAVPRELNVLNVESLEGTRCGVRVGGYAGRVLDYHCSALGRALLAHRGEAERAMLYSLLGPLPGRTARTVTDPVQLEVLLAACRREGWAVEREENAPGVCCVAVPLLRPDGTALAAISVAGPAGRMEPETCSRVGEMLRGAIIPYAARIPD